MLRITEADGRLIPLRTRIPIEIPELLELVANSPTEFLDEIGPKFFLIGVGVRPSTATPVRLNLLAVDETGKAIIVAPLINAGPPVITITSSLLIFRVFPNVVQAVGIVLAIVATMLMALEEEQK